MRRTLEVYEARLEALSKAAFAELDGAYIGTFEVYNTVSSQEECSASIHDCVAIRLMNLVRRKGVGVKGVTSERKTRGRHICHTLLDGESRDEARVVYVGAYNYFTNHVPHPVFSLRSSDKVYERAGA